MKFETVHSFRNHLPGPSVLGWVAPGLGRPPRSLSPSCNEATFPGGGQRQAAASAQFTFVFYLPLISLWSGVWQAFFYALILSFLPSFSFFYLFISSSSSSLCIFISLTFFICLFTSVSLYLSLSLFFISVSLSFFFSFLFFFQRSSLCALVGIFLPFLMLFRAGLFVVRAGDL